MKARKQAELGDELLEKLVVTPDLAARDALLLDALLPDPAVHSAAVWREVRVAGQSRPTLTLARGDRERLPRAGQVEAVLRGDLAVDFLAGVQFLFGSVNGQRACLILCHGELNLATLERLEALFGLSNQLAMEAPGDAPGDSLESIQSLLGTLGLDLDSEGNTPG